MKQIALSIEQMKHLEELGLDTSDASMLWYNWDIPQDTDNWELYINDGGVLRKGTVLAYTLQDILGKLPNEIVDNTGTYNLVMLYPNNILCYEYNDSNGEFDHYVDAGSCDSVLNSAYSSLCWCLKNKYHR